jgi:L-amino acid N-acyltransferase YncA
MIRPATSADAAKICVIYNTYVLDTIVTFEETAVSETDMAARIQLIQNLLPWLVMEENDQIIGYAYANAWKPRAAYRHSVETTIYLDHRFHRSGHGTVLYRALLEQLSARQMHRAIGGVALPNAGSVALHEKLGFRKVAHFTEVGFKLGRWIDVGYWEINL